MSEYKSSWLIKKRKTHNEIFSRENTRSGRPLKTNGEKYLFEMKYPYSYILKRKKKILKFQTSSVHALICIIHRSIQFYGSYPHNFEYKFQQFRISTHDRKCSDGFSNYKHSCGN